MPDEILTGFAGYCVTAATTFAEDRDADARGSEKRERFRDLTPQIRCGMEVYGRARFFTNANLRARTWNLRGGDQGTDSRSAVFQDAWLDEDTLTMVHSIRAAIRDIDALVKIINLLKKFRKNQDSAITEFLYVHDASEASCKSLITSLINDIGEVSAELHSIVKEQKRECANYQLEELGYCANQLNKLSVAYKTIGTGAGNVAITKTALRTVVNPYLDEFDQWLTEWKRRLSEARTPLRDWLGDESNRAKWREASVSNCIDHMIERDSSMLWTALQSHGPQQFKREFCMGVVPFIERGFRAEAYSYESIHSFRSEIHDAAGELSAGKTDDSRRRYRQFMETLVGALIYGPEPSRLSVGIGWEESFEPLGNDVMGGYVGYRIVVSQLLTPDGSVLGDSCVFGPDDIIFLGRCQVVNAYVYKCYRMLSHKSFRNLVKGRRFRVYPIGESYGRVSDMHGVLAYDDGAWMYTDFSRLGTRIVGRGKGRTESDTVLHDAIRELEPGNVLYLGAALTYTDVKDTDQRLYLEAAAVRISRYLDADTIASAGLL